MTVYHVWRSSSTTLAFIVFKTLNNAQYFSLIFNSWPFEQLASVFSHNDYQRKTPDKIGQSAHRSAKNEVRVKITIFTDFG